MKNSCPQFIVISHFKQNLLLILKIPTFAEMINYLTHNPNQQLL
jgi:hypothetical protein